MNTLPAPTCPSPSWRTIQHAIPGHPSQTHAFYVMDFRHNELHTLALDRTLFKGLDGGSATTEELSDFLANELRNLSPDQPVPAQASLHIAAGLALYVRTTDSYRLWSGNSELSDRMHCVVHIYPGIDLYEHFMRCAVTSYMDGLIMPHDELIELSNSIHKADRKRNPEWFAGE
jgi:hypothetical protein